VLALVAFLALSGPSLQVNTTTDTLGQPAIAQIINVLGFWALAAALAGLLISAVVWALGHHASNYQQSFNGRKGVMISGAAALVVGAAPTLVNYFFDLGTKVR